MDAPGHGPNKATVWFAELAYAVDTGTARGWVVPRWLMIAGSNFVRPNAWLAAGVHVAGNWAPTIARE